MQTRKTELQSSEKLELIDHFKLLVKNYKILTLAVLTATISGYGASFLVTPTYTAKVTLLPPQQQSSSASAMLASLGSIGGLAGSVAGLKSPIDQYVAILESRTISDRIVHRFHFEEVYKKPLKSSIRKELSANTQITAGRKDGLIYIEFEDQDPQRAADVANAYAEELQTRTTELALTELQQRRKFFENQTEKVKKRLVEAQASLQSAGISTNALKVEPRTAVEGLASLQAELAATEVRINTLASRLTPDAPEYREAIAKRDAIKTQISSQSRESSNGSKTQLGYIDLLREYKYQEAIYEALSKQLESARLDESREGAQVQIVDAATIPDLKTKPKRAAITAAAGILGLLLTCLWIFLAQPKNASRPQE